MLSHYLVVDVNHQGLLYSHALLILEINKVQHVKWCMKQKQKLTLQQIPLAQLGEYGTDDLEVVSSNPTGDNF